MASTPRYDLERSRYLLAGAGRSRARLRRAHKLEQRAKEQERLTAGAARDSFHEAAIPSSTRQFIARGDDIKSRFWRILGVGLVYFVVAVTVGLALVVGRLLYRVLDWQAPRLIKQLGSPREWWGYIAAVVAGAVAYLLSVVFDWSDTGSLYLASQLVMGAAYAGYLIRAWGWHAVKIARTPKNDPNKQKKPSKKAPVLPSANAHGPSLPAPAFAPVETADTETSSEISSEDDVTGTAFTPAIPGPSLPSAKPYIPSPDELEEADEDWYTLNGGQA